MALCGGRSKYLNFLKALCLVLIVQEISSESHAVSSLCRIATFASYVGRPDAAL